MSEYRTSVGTRAASILNSVGAYLLGGPRVGGEQEERLNRWRNAPAADLTRPHSHARYVVVDVETTGPDRDGDRLVAIGAVAIAQCHLVLDDSFERVLRQDNARAEAKVPGRGIDAEALRSGGEPKAAMLDFLDYLGKSPLVAYRAGFVKAVLSGGVQSILGYPFAHPWIDLALLLSALFPGIRHASLDDWLAHFGLAGDDRHHALADAFATAKLLQIVLEAADRTGVANGVQLIAMQAAQPQPGKR